MEVGATRGRRPAGAWRLPQCTAVRILLGASIIACIDVLESDAANYHAIVREQSNLGNNQRLKDHKVFNAETDLTLKSRKILRIAPTKSLCGYYNGTCTPSIFDLVPDPEVYDYFVQGAVCADHTTKERCDITAGCLWSNDKCLEDLWIFIANCMVDEWLTWRRSSYCGMLGTEEKCGLLKGCSWTGIICEHEVRDLDQAFQTNPTLLEASLTLRNCLKFNRTECRAPCSVASNGDCSFRGMWTTSWFNDSDSTFCKMIKQTWICLEGTPPNCPDRCTILEGSDLGICFTSDEERTRIMYESDPDLRDRMLNALDMCPTFDNWPACNAFRG